MVKFMILFHPPADLDAFENRYNDFLALVETIPDIARRQVISVLGSPQGQAPYYRILELYFDDQPHLQAALRTPEGQRTGAQLYSFPRGSFTTLIADVYEEAGGRTETQNADAAT